MKTGKKVTLGTNDFRFDPRRGEFALEGGRSQYGKWRDDFGNWFGNNNSTIGWHYWLPFCYLERHPEVVVKSIRSDMNDEKRVYPAINLNKSGTRREELLIKPDLLQKVWVLRKFIHDMDDVESMEFILDKMRSTKNNNEFFELMKR